MNGADYLIKWLKDTDTVHLTGLTPPTIDHFRRMGYKVSTWGTHTLVSKRA